MDHAATDLLFVYGTLRAGYAHPMARYLAANADVLGPATCPGRIYHLGSYPGFVDAERDDEHVHGDLFRLHDPVNNLLRLDAYEGALEKPPQYHRVSRPVRHGAEAQAQHAWIYHYALPLNGAIHILSGDFLKE